MQVCRSLEEDRGPMALLYRHHESQQLRTKTTTETVIKPHFKTNGNRVFFIENTNAQILCDYIHFEPEFILLHEDGITPY